ncbi:redoxin domain-containing protein [Pedobacter sp. PAMC26386]|nr:redoxin domain-containing protein [Pedobacter sp. PAMC26386]
MEVFEKKWNYRVGLLFSLLSLIAFNSMGQRLNKGDFCLTGKLLNRDTGTIVLTYTNNLNKYLNDTAIVSKGMFSFKGNISEPVWALLKGNIKSRSMDDPNLTTIFLEPESMKITLEENSFKKAVLVGSKTHSTYLALLEVQKPFYKSLDSLRKKWLYLNSRSKVDTNQVDHYKDSIRILSKDLEEVKVQLKKADLNFIKMNSNSVIGPYVFLSYTDGVTLSSDLAQNLYEQFSEPVKNSALGKEVFKRLKTQKEMVTLQKDSVKVGKAAFNFSRIALNGSSIQLSSYIGKKYVLLDFWATWCKPCIEYTPHLIEIFQKYNQDGLEVISISMDRDFFTWESGVINHNLKQFINVHDFSTGEDLKNRNILRSLSAKYSITLIPTYILINKLGIVEGIYHLNGTTQIPSLDRKLKELFNH